MRGYYNRGVENNPFNFSVRSAGYSGTTKSNIYIFFNMFSVCGVFSSLDPDC